jgi:hypothetical protein
MVTYYYNQLFWGNNHVGKTLPQPRQQPNKNQKSTQTNNKTQNINAQKVCLQNSNNNQKEKLEKALLTPIL